MLQAYRVIGDTSGHFYPVGTVVYGYERDRTILVTASPTGFGRGDSARWVKIRDLEPIEPEPQRISVADMLAEVVRIRDERAAAFDAAVDLDATLVASGGGDDAARLAFREARARLLVALRAVAAVTALDDGVDRP